MKATNKIGPIPDAEAGACEATCESVPDSTSGLTEPEHQPFEETVFDAAAPSPALAKGPRTCRRCAREGRPALVQDPTADVCPRCRCALPGNRRALRHGLRSRPEMHPDTAREFLSRVERVLADAGQADDPPYVFASLARDFTRLELLIESAFACVVDEGAAGKVIEQLAALIATKARLAQQIGLQRRARRMETPAQYWQRRMATHAAESSSAVAPEPA